METQFLDPAAIRLERCDGALALLTDGRKTALAPPRRALPLSNPDEYIVLTDSDGIELGWLRHIAELDDASRVALERTLSETYVVTRILRVREVEKEPLSGQIRWRVEIEPQETGDGAESERGASEPPAGGDSSNGSTPILSTPPGNMPIGNMPLGNMPLGNTTNGNASNSHGPNSNGANGAGPDGGGSMGTRLRRKFSFEKEESAGSTEEREFFIAGTEDVQSARYPQIFIVDTERNRYEISNCEALDIESRRAAERYF